MKLLINDKEIQHFLFSLLGYEQELANVKLKETHVSEIVNWVADLRENPKKLEKYLPKIKGRLEDAVRKDLREFVDTAKTIIKEKRNFKYQIIKQNVEYFIEKVGEDKILKQYKNRTVEDYVKSIGLSINKNAELIRRNNFNSIEEDCVIRNTVGNEELLVQKIYQLKPFWFIDSGYTNFLESNKKWHRLVRNHLHFGRNFSAPVDRLNAFKIFPRQWRNDGDRILIIEPGVFSAAIFNIDIKKWKYNVEAELRNYTDKKIVFREKSPKKTRLSLYNYLLDEDFYCIVNVNSNAATESIWAGIPVITLDTHISNPVAKNKLSDINDLYRGPLAEWLCMLSYSQFTFEELINGTASKIIKKYHG